MFEREAIDAHSDIDSPAEKFNVDIMQYALVDFVPSTFKV